jgi:peptide/nickel transport system substrate-binding protein
MKKALILTFLTGSQLLGASGNQSVTIAWESDVRFLDPRYAIDANSQYLEDLVHCSLIAFDSKGGQIPYLASQMPEWQDDLHLKVKIKSGVKFSDNKPVTAADVKATYGSFLVKDNPDPSPRASAFHNIADIKVSGKDEVIFTLKEADATFISNLVVGILPEKLAKGKRITEAKDIVGCGPFKVENVDVLSINLKKNNHYTLKPLPQVDTVEIKIIKDEKTRFAKLQKGEIDLVQNNVNPETLKDVSRKYPQLVMQKKLGLRTSYLGFNMKDPLTGNAAVRKAMAHAVDRKVIIEYILGGFAVPAETMLPPEDPFYMDQSGYELDVAKANKILDDAGFKKKGNGVRFELTYKTTTDVTRVNIAKALASQFKKIGIKVNVMPMEWGKFKEDVEKGRIQLWSLTWVGFKDPDIYRYAFATESFPPNGGNRGYYSNPKLDQLVDKGKVTTNLEERKKIYGEVQQIVNNDLPYIFLWHEENYAVYSRQLKGFSLYADGRMSSLTNVYKSAK